MKVVTTCPLMIRSFGIYDHLKGITIPANTVGIVVNRDNIDDVRIRSTLLAEIKILVETKRKPFVIKFCFNGSDVFQILLRENVSEYIEKFEDMNINQIDTIHIVNRTALDGYNIVERMIGWKWYVIGNDKNETVLGSVWTAPPMNGKAYRWWVNDKSDYSIMISNDRVRYAETIDQAAHAVFDTYNKSCVGQTNGHSQ